MYKINIYSQLLTDSSVTWEINLFVQLLWLLDVDNKLPTKVKIIIKMFYNSIQQFYTHMRFYQIISKTRQIIFDLLLIVFMLVGQILSLE